MSATYNKPSFKKQKMGVGRKSVLVFLSILYLTCGCSSRTPKYDLNVGTTEQQIFEKFGKPNEKTVEPAKELKDELRGQLESKVKSGNIPIKELYYHFSDRERIFWLVQGENGIWVVVSDAEIPQGVVY